jgi:hypothetical protein
MTATAPTLTLADLEAILARTDPAVLLVPPRILRRVIKQHRQLGGLGLQVPHRKSYVLPAEALLRSASRGELGLTEACPIANTVILLPHPVTSVLADPPETLLAYWRLLFHARVHLTLSQLRAQGKLTDAAVASRIERIGRRAFEEARAVLAQDGLQLPPADAPGVYEEFTARYLELRCFAPHHLPRHFPAIDSFDAVDVVLAQDVQFRDLLERTRPDGAPDSVPPAEPEPIREEAQPEAPPPDAHPDPAAHQRLMIRAQHARARGNNVRAAILRQQALRVAPTGQLDSTRKQALREIEQLASRLRRALGFPEREIEEWTQALLLLLEPASRGIWNVSARLLYDLQKVCIDQERAIYAVDLVEWFVSWFRRPIKRRLPLQPQVLTVKHLRSAANRLPGVRLSREVRGRLRTLLQSAVEHAEARLREQLRPPLVHALDSVGLVPGNYPERVSREKLVEELLDRVVERGFLNLGDLRDALARNQVKLPDMRDPIQFFTGDPLLMANRQLAWDLDGIYRRGEIYLRWLQRLSSLIFGNPIGRWLTLFLVLPFGGAFALLVFVQEMLHLPGLLRLPSLHLHLTYSQAGLHKAMEHAAKEAAKHPEKAHHNLFLNPAVTFGSLAVLGVFLLLLLHVPPFRRKIGEALHLLWRGVRGLFYLPGAFLQLPPVRSVLQSRPYLLFFQYVAKPLACTLPFTLALELAGTSWPVNGALSAALFLVACLLLNSWVGIYLEEWWADRLVRTWRTVSRDLLPGLLRAIMDFFRWLMEYVERGLYAVDEWLRFRSGEGPLSFVFKLVFGLVWFWVTYVLRFVFYVLFEPQVNPVKHFPVVTVSHKLMLLTAKPLTDAVHPWLAARYPAWDLTPKKTLGLVGLGLGLVPGAFGFLAWELKENWRLYRANRSPTLVPDAFGSHGETVLRLLRPGFHSGTVPKLFAKLRHVHGRSARKAEENLHHVEESVRHFVERDFIALLAGSPSWGLAASLTVGEVHLATYLIRIELCCPGLGPEGMLLDIEQRGGWLVAGIARAGWLERLGEEQTAALVDALAGFYHLAGVDVVREQVRAALPPGTPFEITEQGLVVEGVVYDLGDPLCAPSFAEGSAPQTVVPADQLVFNRRPIRWADWVACWDTDLAGKGHGIGLLPGVRLLPPVGGLADEHLAGAPGEDRISMRPPPE